MSDKDKDNQATCFVLLMAAFALSFWTNRNLDFWSSFFQGHPVDVPYWVALLASVPVYIAFGFNVIAEILRWFV